MKLLIYSIVNTIPLLMFLLCIPQLAFADALVSVEGQHCYLYGDDESVNIAKKKALALAREVAVSNFKVWVEVNTSVKNYQLEEDWVETIAVGMLRNEKREIVKKFQEICTTVKAKINPQEVDALIAERKKQSAMKQRVTTQTSDSNVGLQVWLNNPDGQYVEGEYLVINVQSDHDAYLKLDYFQADCMVVHLVPNLFRQQAFIKKNTIYTFGTEDTPERFKIQGPFGDEVIKVIASKTPFPASQISSEVISHCEPYVQKLEQGLTRGISVEHVVSADASLFTSSLKQFEHKRAKAVIK